MVESIWGCCLSAADRAELDVAEWTTPQHSRGEIRRVSKTLVKPGVSIADYLHAVDVVNNWRSSHSYPLQTVLMLVRSNAYKIDSGADVVRRIKRLRSIEKKLRKTHLDLTEVQDLGGCRAVVRDPVSASALVACLKNSRTRHEIYDSDDYIENPKSSGYRSYQLMFRCRSEGRPEFNGLRIE